MSTRRDGLAKLLAIAADCHGAWKTRRACPTLEDIVVKKLLACLIAAPALLIVSLSHAARLDLVSGSVGGGMQMSVTVGASPLVVGALVQDTSTAALVAGSGSFLSAMAHAGGQANFAWQRAAALQTSGTTAQWLLTGASTMNFKNMSGITEVFENSNVNLSADLLIADDLQPSGTPVRLSLDAATLFNALSTVPGLAAASQFELTVVQGLDVLARLSSVDTSSNFNVEFLSEVGANLSLQISHLNTPYVQSNAFDAPAGGLRFQSTDFFSGTLTVSAIPEPGAATLWLVGLGALGFYKNARARRRI